MKNPWFLKKITDYWDQPAGAIENFAKKLDSLSDSDESQAIIDISSAIRKHTGVLTNDLIIKVAFTMIDDLYKVANRINFWGGSLPNYLDASSRTFLNLLSERGYFIHYLVDNECVPTPYGMHRPLQLFPDWFNSVGLIYICPQYLATKLMEHDSHEPESYIELLPKYIEEGRLIGRKLIKKCCANNHHFFYLDTNASQTPSTAYESFKLAMEKAGASNIITIFRNEGPSPGSKIMLIPPNHEKC